MGFTPQPMSHLLVYQYGMGMDCPAPGTNSRQHSVLAQHDLQCSILDERERSMAPLRNSRATNTPCLNGTFPKLFFFGIEWFWLWDELWWL